MNWWKLSTVGFFDYFLCNQVMNKLIEFIKSQHVKTMLLIYCLHPVRHQFGQIDAKINAEYLS